MKIVKIVLAHKTFLVIPYLMLLAYIIIFRPFLDSTIWTINGITFQSAIEQHAWSKTYIGTDSMHPGVTIMWVVTIMHTMLPLLPLPNLIMEISGIFLLIMSLLFYNAFKLSRNFIPPQWLFTGFIYLFFNSYFILTGLITWLDLLITSFYFFTAIIWLKYLKDQKVFYLVWIGIITGLIILTKFLGAAIVPVMAVVGFIYHKQYSFSLSKLIRSLILVVVISAVTFIILYPAMWTNSTQALLSRFDKNDGKHRIELIRNSKIVTLYNEHEIKFDPLIYLTPIMFVIIAWKRKKLEYIDLLGISGLVYLAILFITIQILVDPRRGPSAFTEGLSRYMVPGIAMIAPFFFYRFCTGNYHRYLKIGMVIFLFGMELYQLRTILLFHWLFMYVQKGATYLHGFYQNS